MRSKICCSLLLLLGILTVIGGAVETRHLEFAFDSADVEIQQRPNGTVVVLRDGVLPEDAPGTPWLPARYVDVLIPAGATITRIRYGGEERLLRDGVVLMPVQLPRSPSLPEPAVVGPDAAAYRRHVKLPEHRALVEQPRDQRGYRLVTLRLNPVRWVPTTGELFLTERLTVDLHYALPRRAPTVPERNHARFRRQVLETVVNPEDEARSAPLLGRRARRTIAAEVPAVIVAEDGGEHPMATTLSFSVSRVDVAETAGSVVLTVQRTGDTGTVETVDYATVADGGATAGSDFTATSGTLTFAVGETSRTITVPILDDAASEGAEVLFVTLMNNPNLSQPSSMMVTIIDDDSPGVLAFATAAVAAREDDGIVTLTVTRSGGSEGPATVHWATAAGTATTGADFQAASGTFTWADGEADDRTFTVTLVDDAVFEGLDETFIVTLSDAIGATLGAQDDATVTIEEDEAVTDPVDYLIITGSGLTDAFQVLADHRTASNGFTTRVITTAAIYATYPGADNQAMIRACIDEHYQQRGTAYVVLGGDNTIIPDRDTRVVCSTYTQTDLPTDLYYADLSGDWDADGDGIFGEANQLVGGSTVDEGDLAVEVLVGRIPVRTAAHVAAYVNKLIAYETNPPMDIARKFLASGHTLWDTYSSTDRPTDAMSDGHLAFDDADHPTVADDEMWMRRTFRDRVQGYGWVPTHLGFLFNTLTSWDGVTAGSYAASPANLVTRYSEGWNFVINDTHGNTTVLAAEGGSFGSGSAANLTGPTNFFYTGACLSGGFDTAEPSVSEAMLRNPNGGALVYLGCSRYGWGSADAPPASNYSTGGTSSIFMRYWLEELFSKHNLESGPAFYAHKARYAGSAGSDGSVRWIYFGLNLQGDPAIPIIGVKTLVRVTVDATSITEDGGPATLTITRLGDTTDALDLPYTRGGTATSGGDYTTSPTLSASGILTIPAGSDRITFVVQPVDDSTAEPDEDVVFTLGAGADYERCGATTTVTIWDDDGAGRLRLTTAAATVAEGAGSVSLQVERVAGSTGAVAVSYATANATATAGTDYTATSGTLSWAAGGTGVKTITVPIASDFTYEPADETFTVTLSSPTGGAVLQSPSSASVTIDDDDNRVTIAATDASATEGGGTGTYRITREGPTTLALTVAYAFDAGGSTATTEDFTLSPAGSVSFAVGQATKDITLTAVDDADCEPAETVRLAIVADPTSTIGSPSSAVVTIELSDNAAPVVDAGVDQTVTTAWSCVLAGSVTDDGNPDPPGAVTIAWSQVAGPGTATFADAADPSTTVGFDTAGSYTLQLSADDGMLVSTDTVVIAVDGPLMAVATADVAGGAAPLTVQFTGQALGGSPVGTPTAGLVAEFYDLSTTLSAVPDFSILTPTVTRIDAQVDYASTSGVWTGLPSNFQDTFAARFSGLVLVTTAGDYTFATNSDDGSNLYIDAVKVVANDGSHGMTKKTGTVTLAAGYHHLRVEFFEGTGGAGLIASWAGPGFTDQVIEAGALFHLDYTDGYTYAWDFDASDGIQVEATERNPQHEFTTTGSYVVTLTVGDGTGTATDQVIIVVGDQPVPRCITLQVIDGCAWACTAPGDATVDPPAGGAQAIHLAADQDAIIVPVAVPVTDG